MDTIALPQALFTVNDLLALSGLVVAVYVIVLFLKDPLKMLAQKLTGSEGDWIVRPITVLVALGILVWIMMVQGVVTTETIGLAIINAFLVALIAGAAHDYIVAPTKAKTDKKLIAAENAQLDLILDSIKPQVPDVSPPIITPQQSSTSSNSGPEMINETSVQP